MAVLVALSVAIITTPFFSATTNAAPGINQTLSFSGRLLNASGGVVPDGYYNIQFKIYQDGDGQQANNTGGTGGALKWTETYINNYSQGGVHVSSGFFSVNLGSKDAFGSQVDWNQDTLWLSMNIAGNDANCTGFGTGGASPCTPDGEMLPMKRITSTPYAMNAGMLGGKTADGFIQNQNASPQTGDFNISGTGTATTLQGNTSVIAPLYDRADSGTLAIGTVNATTINIGTNSIDHTINIGTGNATQLVTIGSKAYDSYTLIQGGNDGIRLESNRAVAISAAGIDMIQMPANGNLYFQVGGAGSLLVRDGAGDTALNLDTDNRRLTLDYDYGLVVQGSQLTYGNATFQSGITVQGGGALTYTTPGGYNMSTAINIPNYAVGDFGSILAFGLPSTSAATARGILLADARTSTHQATIGVLSPDENNIMGFSWNGSTSTGYLSNTANSLALQGNGLDLLTATNNGGAANIGIGNNASAGYALDVTGSINASGSYLLGGTSALTTSALNFSANTTSTINAASGRALDINSDTSINIVSGGTTVASFGNTLKVGSGSGTGQPVLLTLDRASSTPTATGSGFIGSMYYDTSLNAVQCYNGTSWGSCDTSPANFVTLSPEFSGAVLQGSGSGTMTAGICSSNLHINDGTSGQPTICGTNETQNFYDWTSASGSSQTYNIFVSYQLPSNFTNFVAGTTSLLARTDSSNSYVSYQVYRKAASGALASCGSNVVVSTGVKTSWQKGTAGSTSDPSTCSFAAGDTLFVGITAGAYSNANAYIGTLNFAYK